MAGVPVSQSDDFPALSFHIIVYDNSALGDTNTTTQFEEQCSSLGVRYERVPQNGLHPGDASWSHASAVEYLWRREATVYQDAVMLLDHDMFLIAPFPWAQVSPPGVHLTTVLQSRRRGDCELSPDPTCAQQTVFYIWPNFAIFNPMTSFANLGVVELDWGPREYHGVRLDTGGQTAPWLERFLNTSRVQEVSSSGIDAKWRAMHFLSCSPLERMYAARNTALMELLIPTTDQQQSSEGDYGFLAGLSILHYRAGSAWDRKGASVEEIKWSRVKRVLEEAVRWAESDYFECVKRSQCGGV